MAKKIKRTKSDLKRSSKRRSRKALETAAKIAGVELRSDKKRPPRMSRSRHAGLLDLDRTPVGQSFNKAIGEETADLLEKALFSPPVDFESVNSPMSSVSAAVLRRLGFDVVPQANVRLSDVGRFDFEMSKIVGGVKVVASMSGHKGLVSTSEASPEEDCLLRELFVGGHVVNRADVTENDIRLMLIGLGGKSEGQAVYVTSSLVRNVTYLAGVLGYGAKGSGRETIAQMPLSTDDDHLA